MVRRMDLAALGGKDKIGASQRKMVWDKEGGWRRVRRMESAVGAACGWQG